MLVFSNISRYAQNIETLRGIIPICSYCKEIRDDEGYWNQVETYVAKHADASFSHGICPTCFVNRTGDSGEEFDHDPQERTIS